MKRWISLLLCLSIMIGVLGTSVSYASEDLTDEILLDEFFEEIKTNKYYLMHEKVLTTKEPNIKNINITEDGKVLFLLFELNNEGKSESNHLIFMKELENDNTHILFVDYMEDNIVINNLTTGEAISYYSYNCETWVCTNYEEYGGEPDQKCRDVIGLGCVILGNIPLFGRIVCYLGTIVLCHIPAERYCIDGEWKPICEY